MNAIATLKEKPQRCSEAVEHEIFVPQCILDYALLDYVILHFIKFAKCTD